MAKVFIEPVGVTLEVDEAQDLLTALLAAGIAIPSDCAGRGTCAKCLVRLGSGELTRADRGRDSVGCRRTCATTAGASPARRARSRGASASRCARPAAGGASSRRRSCTTARRAPPSPGGWSSCLPATFEDKRADQDRLLAACAACGDGRQAALGATRELPDILRRARLARRRSPRTTGALIDVEPPDAPAVAYGAAVDIGTSKVIAYLFDLEAGRLVDQEAVENPQMRYGEEVISRIARAVDADGAAELAAAARDGVNQVLGELCARNDLEPRHIYDMTVVGNTAMHHLALGLSPVGLGAAPFAPAVAAPSHAARDRTRHRDEPGGRRALPAADRRLRRLRRAGRGRRDAPGATKRRPCLALDIGTNTEIAVAHDGRVTRDELRFGTGLRGLPDRPRHEGRGRGDRDACASTTPACPTEVTTIGNLPALGMCGSGIVDLLAGLVASGVVDRTGRHGSRTSACVRARTAASSTC